ncbi:MAG: biotin transporter BioY [Rickettsiaceae bacterium]|nr:biotin transporter BioY [Rickettsiaceae bacterium]
MIKSLEAKNILKFEFAAKVVLAVLLLAASAQLSIPLNPVPITLQTCLVMVIGLTYSPMAAFLGTVTYVFLGSIGAPIFQNFTYGFFGVTAGYKVGFIASATLTAYVRHIFGDGKLKTVLYCMLGTAVIFVFGVAWLSTIIGFEAAIFEGGIKFIPTGLIKIGIVSSIVGYLRSEEVQ